MEYLRTADLAALVTPGPTLSKNQVLLEVAGDERQDYRISASCLLPGFTEERHTHPFDQHFYIVSGIMDVYADGTVYKAGPGTLVVNPKGVPHRGGNSGSEPVIRLGIVVPTPKPGELAFIPAPE